MSEIITNSIFEDPLSVMEEYRGVGVAEMSRTESGFLCERIKEAKPSKIVEIGVAQGGTTTLILECLRIMNCSAEVYSVDINRSCWSVPTEQTGFVAERYLKDHPLPAQIKHKFVLGGTIAKALDEIGKDIDFVILDTMHFLPGELLDLIALYHSLTPSATVVFHDVAQSLNPVGNADGSPLEFASLVTMVTLSGEKFWLDDPEKIANYGNIAAIKLDCTSDSTKDNLFRGLFLSWDYLPSEQHLREYEKRIEREWGTDKLSLFKSALTLNTFALYRRNRIKVNIRYIREQMEYLIKSNLDIYVYGAGEIGKKVEQFFDMHGKKIAGFIVTEKTEGDDRDNVFQYDCLNPPRNYKIVLGLGERHHPNIISIISKTFGSEALFLNNGIGYREMMQIVAESVSFNSNEKYIDSNGYLQAINRAENG